MKQRKLLLGSAAALALLALTSPWWGRPALQFLTTNSDLIQSLQAALQILLWIGTAVALVAGWRLKATPPSAPPTHVTGQSGSGALAHGTGAASAGQQGVAVAGPVHAPINSPTTIIQSSPSSDAHLRRYLDWLRDDCAPLKLKAIDQAAAKPGATPLGLTSIYVDLDTELRLPEKQTLAQHVDAQRRATAQAGKSGFRDRELLESGQREEKETRLVPVLEALGTHEKLVILGAPGSGKSTLAAYVALNLAQAQLGQTAALERLGQWWKFGPLLPIRVVLRHFATGLPAKPTPGRAGDLWDFLDTELQRLGLPAGTAGALRQHASDHGALFLFDGLDEARDTATRLRVLQAVTEFTQTAGKKCRFLLTSRPYAWQEFQPPAAGQPHPTEHAAVLAALPDAYRLADFNADQIQTFITHWYNAVQAAGWLTETDARDKAADLQRAVRREDLAVLARNPLLLTLMATLHSNRTRLPEDRADLYNEVVELLLQRWNEKSGDDRGLLDALAIPSLKLGDLRRVMQQLAFEAHAKHAGKDGVADIPEGDLTAALRPLLANDAGKADLALDYIEKRAGLLLGQGELGRQRQFTFPHRTFQEYLAACYLAGCHDFCLKAGQLAQENAGHWREVLTLAARHAQADRGVPAADALVHSHPVAAWLHKHSASEGDWRASVVAGEQLLEIGLAAVNSREDHRAVHERIAGWLVALLEQGALPPADRAKAGAVLARLGDSRPGVGLRPDGLPDIDWIEIPAGPFPMGNDKPEAEYDDESPRFTCDLIRQPYRISRYPVTVAQFEEFVQADGYREPRFWTQAGWKWKGDRTRPEDYDAVFQTRNHPRVGVSWYEAMAFCRWLSEQLKLNITLPSEAEWERAARHTDGRVYPWGNATADVAQHCNLNATGLNHTSPVGMFATGHAVCGAADMAGNVWDWCRTLWRGNYEDYQQQVRDEAEAQGARVLRGGAFGAGAGGVRCACRLRYNPASRYDYLGFRLVASPFVSGR